jgi:hypothetical protein
MTGTTARTHRAPAEATDTITRSLREINKTSVDEQNRYPDPRR